MVVKSIIVLGETEEGKSCQFIFNFDNENTSGIMVGSNVTLANANPKDVVTDMLAKYGIKPELIPIPWVTTNDVKR